MRILLLLILSIGTHAIQAQSTDKLIAYFSFNSCSPKDDSGNGPDGAFDGGIGCACGIGQALELDSADNAAYFIGPLASVFTTSDFTVSFYMRADRPQFTTASQSILSKMDSCKADRAFWVRYNGKSRVISSGISQNDTLGTVVQAKLDEGPCWQYITITRSNLVYSLYVNGTLRDTRQTRARVDISTQATLKLGTPVCPLDITYRGLFDELRIHSKALSKEEIAKYNQNADRISNSDTLLYLGKSMQVNTNAYCPEGFVWTPATGVSNVNIGNPMIAPVLPGYYIVQTNYDGCVASDSIFINVIDPDTLDCSQIFIPNAFTPGASPELNDKLGISNFFAVDEFISFEIFDRWGGRVFNAKDVEDAWDGTFNGDPVNPGVFLYRLRYKCEGVEKVKSGTLTALK